MGFFNHCWEAVLHLAAFAHYIDNQQVQQPLPLSYVSRPVHEIVTAGVTFAPPNATINFTCQYPTLTGWRACNSADDRQCWLDNPSQTTGLHQYNITTDCGYPKQALMDMTNPFVDEVFTPPGVTREVRN